MPMQHLVVRAAFGLLAAGAVGCSPTLDWREVRPQGGEIVALFPCRPSREERVVGVADVRVTLRMHGCKAAGSTFALGLMDLPAADMTTPVLADLRRRAAANLGAGGPGFSEFGLRGATPNPQSSRIRVTGKLPDGSAVVEHAVFFTRGLRVYQAFVIGAAEDPAAIELFFSGLRIEGGEPGR
jgi:hypothetical protein